MKGTAVTLMCALVTTLAGSLAWADDDTPEGRWRQFDDATGETKSVVRIYAHDGVIEGKIVKLLKEPGPGKHRRPVCDQCEGEIKNHPYEIVIRLREGARTFAGLPIAE